MAADGSRSIPPTTPRPTRRIAAVVEDLYIGLDAIVGETLDRLAPDDLLVVMSDHGFASWRAVVQSEYAGCETTATWCARSGVRAARPGAVRRRRLVAHARLRARAERALHQRQRARGSTASSIPADREALVTEIADKLLRTIDPATGAPAITTDVPPRRGVYGRRGTRTSRPI